MSKPSPRARKRTDHSKAIEGLEYDGPPELERAWNEFAHVFAERLQLKQSPRSGTSVSVPAYGFRPEYAQSYAIDCANLMNALVFKGDPAKTPLQRAEAFLQSQGELRTVAGRGYPGDNPFMHYVLPEHKQRQLEDFSQYFSFLEAVDCGVTRNRREIYNTVTQRMADMWADYLREVDSTRNGNSIKCIGYKRGEELASVEEARKEVLRSPLGSMLSRPLRMMSYFCIEFNIQKAIVHRPDLHSDAEQLADKLFHSALFRFESSHDTDHGRPKLFNCFVRDAIGGQKTGSGSMPGISKLLFQKKDNKHPPLRMLTNKFSQTKEEREEGDFIPEIAAAEKPDLVMLGDRRQVLLGAISTLKSANQRHVLIERYGLNGGEPKTLEEVGQELQLTRERVRQIEARAIAALAKYFDREHVGAESYLE